jgi:hypothetical protein
VLWEERQLVSVANLTRQDAVDFLQIAPRAGIVTHTTPNALRDADQALDDLRNGRFEGAAALVSAKTLTVTVASCPAAIGTTRYATIPIANVLPMTRTRGGLFDDASAAALSATWDAASKRRTTIAESICASMPLGHRGLRLHPGKSRICEEVRSWRERSWCIEAAQ